MHDKCLFSEFTEEFIAHFQGRLLRAATDNSILLKNSVLEANEKILAHQTS